MDRPVHEYLLTREYDFSLTFRHDIWVIGHRGFEQRSQLIAIVDFGGHDARSTRGCC